MSSASGGLLSYSINNIPGIRTFSFLVPGVFVPHAQFRIVRPKGFCVTGAFSYYIKKRITSSIRDVILEKSISVTVSAAMDSTTTTALGTITGS